MRDHAITTTLSPDHSSAHVTVDVAMIADSIGAPDKIVEVALVAPYGEELVRTKATSRAGRPVKADFDISSPMLRATRPPTSTA